MTLAEVVELTAETLMELQKTVERIADTAADKTEVHALETRVAALETAMPRPTATADAPADSDVDAPARSFLEIAAGHGRGAICSTVSDRRLRREQD